MLTFTTVLSPNPLAAVQLILPLTAAERSRSRHRFLTIEGVEVMLKLPRGKVLKDGDLLRSDSEQELVRIVAKPEPVLTVTSPHQFELLRAAYHLGNRHVSLEIAPSYLRMAPDPVLRGLLEQLGLTVEESIFPFQPETGAYAHPIAH
jgi:urease accessory protein